MTDFEKREIASLPPKYRPMGAWSYFGYTILFGIPLIGLICLIVFSLSDNNINRRSFARSFFCVLIIALVITAVTLALSGGLAALGSILPSGSAAV